MSDSPPRLLIIGAGSRGRGYAEAAATSSNGIVASVAEPVEYKRMQLGKRFIWGDDLPSEGSHFSSWTDFITYETARRQRVQRGDADVPPGVDAVFVCVLDEQHREVVIALAQLGGLHIMCEKPLATTLDDCVDMCRALQGQDTLFSIGHVLRYSPHNILLRRLVLEDRVIGDVLSVEHTEPVGWWHFTHSYVRGNWRRESTTAPSLLTKSCHDIDVLLWLLCSPPSYADEAALPHLPSTVSSSGARQFFRQSRKPLAAGKATNCLSCPAEPECKYSARRIYVGNQLRGLGTNNTRWPVSIVVPEIEELHRVSSDRANKALLEKLAEDYDESTPEDSIAARNWFGRCVFESDNDVCDEQVVTMTWEEDAVAQGGPYAMADSTHHRGAKTAIFHMVAHTKKICDRYTHVYGVDGEIYADSATITVEDFRTGTSTTHRPRVEHLGHGGGDAGLTRQFVLAVDKVKNHGWSVGRAQREIVGCTLEEIIRSHAMVFCAEESRKTRQVLDWKAWWAQYVAAGLATKA
jgi:predicted dehydrogenase